MGTVQVHPEEGLHVFVPAALQDVHVREHALLVSRIMDALF